MYCSLTFVHIAEIYKSKTRKTNTETQLHRTLLICQHPAFQLIALPAIQYFLFNISLAITA